MRCKHESFEFENEEAYVGYTITEYKCKACRRRGFRSIEHVTEDNIRWEDSL